MKVIRDQKRLLVVYFAFYYAVLLFFFLDQRLLFQYQPIFFNYNRDLSELALIATGLPKWMIHHPFSFGLADGLAFLLPVPLIITVRRRIPGSWLPGLVFILFWALYLLLADIFWQVHHEPFILYLLIPVAFCIRREDHFYRWLAGCRYYFCYLFFSAAAWKIARGALFNTEEMSRILLVHHGELLTAGCDTLRCRFYSFLIDHPGLSWWIYAAGVTLEASFVAGFFTRRYDRLLLGLAAAFVAADLLIMHIPYWTVLMGGVTLLLGRQRGRPADDAQRGSSFSTRNTPGPLRRIVLYETTHHENLPALLDSSEADFDAVTLFLKRISYDNLSGHNDLSARWPKTRFIIQPDDCPNRRFILRMFSFLRKHRYSHLHLATLDNNLLLFALLLCSDPDLQVSLTVHEVNEYFARSFRGLRDWTETVAKLILHQRILHYTCFLPAMVERVQKKLPSAVVVFIPSRFYRGSGPAGNTASRPPATAPDKPRPEAAEPAVLSMPVSEPHLNPSVPAPPFTIVIPGSIEANRRDYDGVIDFFCRHLPFSKPVRLVILGNAASPYAQMVISRLRPLTGVSFQLLSFDGYVAEQEYEAQITAADLLWSPLNVHKTSSRNSPETYGQTTASGLTADLLLSPVPALVPSDFTIPVPFRPAMLTYHSPDDIKQYLEKMLQDDAYRSALRNEIAQALLYFNRKNFDEAFRRLMDLPAKSD